MPSVKRGLEEPGEQPPPKRHKTSHDEQGPSSQERILHKPVTWCAPGLQHELPRQQQQQLHSLQAPPVPIPSPAVPLMDEDDDVEMTVAATAALSIEKHRGQQRFPTIEALMLAYPEVARELGIGLKKSPKHAEDWKKWCGLCS